jgi:hypothetical protein
MFGTGVGCKNSNDPISGRFPGVVAEKNPSKTDGLSVLDRLVEVVHHAAQEPD